LGAYDGNVIGGLLVGIGMSVSGACPGTVLVQVANGSRSGVFAALGCLLGGALFVVFSPILKRMAASQVVDQMHTVQKRFQFSTRVVLLGFEALCLVILGLSSLIMKTNSMTRHWLSPILGGVLIGLAQALSMLLTRKTVGVSTAWEDAGRYIHSWKGVGAADCPRTLRTPSILFAGGVLLGSLIVAHFLPLATYASAQVSPVAAVLGGVSMVFGARLAGGCTSGHGISGMASFSISSFITVASMFSGGILTAMVF